ncbi:hypothetical protein [Mucilaginibacter sp. dw_454]|uniref:hypothetical protein n=1 Tax=Mucilaginibacter sp. dw_454 TaxID=2720079 RepID=UPI001BD40100|nr:hypothetical protein [Mucilaginibacter sp. dw_454]
MKPKFFIYCLFCFLILHLNAVAQDIKLQNIIKITFDEGIPDNNLYPHKTVEVVPEQGQWKSYQTVYYTTYDPKTKNPFSDSTRRFIKIISADTLTLLLDIISKKDTTVNERNFNISINQLIKYTDTVDKEINPQQKQRFIDAIENKSIVHDALMSCVFPIMRISSDGGGGSSIVIKTKDGKDVGISKMESSFINGLPWGNNEEKLYDPRITDIYYAVMNNVKEAQRERGWMYRWIDKMIYQKYFQTAFYWEDFKIKHPEVYASFKGTLTPARLVKGNGVTGDSYVSSRLPAYALIIFWLHDNLDSAIYKYKSYEDTVVSVFKKRNFLFDYIKSKKDTRVYVYAGRMAGKNALGYVREIKEYYPEIEKLNRYKALLIACMNPNKTSSRWMILPNDQLLLLDYTGKLVYTADGKFDGFVPDSGVTRHHVCLVFDSKGNRIGGSDNANVGKY